MEVLSENLLPKEMIQDEEWLIHQVSFKPWPACRHCHAAIDAAIALHKDFDHDEACQVVVQTYSDAIDFCDRPIPVTPAQGRFSLQHCVSVGLLKGDVSSSDFTENRLHDSQIEALRKNVRICEDPSFTQAYPNHFGSAVKVMNSNGKKKTVKIA